MIYHRLIHRDLRSALNYYEVEGEDIRVAVLTMIEATRNSG
jgi:hypothetical protein